MKPAFALESLENRRLFTVTVNDARYAEQADLSEVDVTRAWAKTTGNLNVVVADIDTGLDYSHPDLFANVWINQAEIPGFYRKHIKDVDGDGRISFYDLDSRKNRRWMTDVNGNGLIDAGDILVSTKRGGWDDGFDADANSYTDDLIGWDFAGNDNDPFDHFGHGTHTAGTISAIADNGQGIAGISQSSLMVVKIFDDAGDSATEDQVAAAIRYSADEGARVSNNSWGYTIQPTFGRGYGGGYGNPDDADDVIYQAIQYAGEKGQLFVAAAGNDTVNNDFSFFGSYPASYDLDNIVSVAAVDADGALSYFSNYGSNTVDLAAPGEDVLSTWLNDGYKTVSGTSMATPHVTATLALMLARYPKLTTTQLKADLLNSVNVNTSVYFDLVSGGTLDTGEAVYLASQRRTAALAAKKAKAAAGTKTAAVKATVFSNVKIVGLIDDNDSVLT